MAVSLVTDEFPIALDRNFRLALINNFKIIESQLNRFDDFYASLPDEIKNGSGDLEKNITTEMNSIVKDLNSRINRILLGIDNESIELVVTQILKDKGVID